MLNTSSILDTAADLIVEKGWFQGACPSYSPKLCANMAIGEAAKQAANLGASVTYDVAARAFLNHIFTEQTDLHQPVRGNAIVFWNDASGRTQEEVIQALRGAAQQYKEA